MLLYFTVANIAQYQPLSVSIGNKSGDLSSIFNGNDNDGTGRYWLQLAPPRLFNTLHIEHNNVAQDVLTLCEILVYDTGLSNIYVFIKYNDFDCYTSTTTPSTSLPMGYAHVAQLFYNI